MPASRSRFPRFVLRGVMAVIELILHAVVIAAPYQKRTDRTQVAVRRSGAQSPARRVMVQLTPPFAGDNPSWQHAGMVRAALTVNGTAWK